MERLYKLFLQHPVICTDSRDIIKNSIFFALKGEHFNGNSFAMQAIEDGVAYAIVDDTSLPSHPQFLFVENVLQALQDLACFHRKQLKIPVIAITGTNGKTTTKELVSQVLSSKYKVGVTKGNLNNHIGVPLTLLSMNKTTQIAVVEMGASHPNEIELLCRIALPDYGLITNIGKAHLEGFGSLDGVKKAKGELYDYLTEHKGTIFYNSDNQMLSSMISGRKPEHTIAYGIRVNKANVLPSNSEYPFLRLLVNSYPEITTHLIGNYNTDNVLAALAVGKAFEITAKEAATALSTYMPSNNRSQLLRTAKHTIIMDAYNANPTSMTAAIENFATLQKPNKWVVLGDMLELGKDTATEHAAIIDLLKIKNIRQIFLVGTHFTEANINNEFKSFPSVEDLGAYIQIHPIDDNAMIMLKGSRGIKLEKLVAYL
jgi:UDP-N-acetylmuramoyl-tripeptide--D-alanyl-D-alanine ligase